MSDFSLFAHYQLSEDQNRPVHARHRDIAVVAGAGTGKTRTLVGRFLSLVADGIPLRRIVAITFTRKAAREMRNRIRRELETALQSENLHPDARRRLSAQRNRLDAARISTIHTFCAELLRTHPAEAGVDPRFRLLDEAEAALARNDAVDQTVADAADDPASLPLFTTLGVEGLRRVLEILLRQRLEASEVFAGFPATPQTRWQEVLTQRQSDALQRLWAADAFTAAVADLRAARPLKDDDRMVVQRSIALDALSRAAPDAPLSQRLDALQVLNEINLRGGSQSAWEAGREAKDRVKSALGTLRDLWSGSDLLSLRLNEADDRLAGLLPDLRRRFDSALAAYQTFKNETDALDFDDLEARALNLLQNDREVRRYWQNTIRALLVDEFQDTNQRQRDLVALLCDEPGKLFIVGDAKQSIYRFRGADVTVFRQERERIGAGQGLVSRLETSYRSHDRMVRALNLLMHPLLGDPGPGRPPWEEPFAPLDPARQAPRAGIDSPYVRFLLAAGSKSDGALQRAAAALVEQITTLTAASELTPGDIAILCRSTRAFAAYEDALDAAGIPYLTISGRGFYDRPEIRDLINALQAIADPTDDLALLGLLRSPAGGLTDGALFRLVEARRAAAREEPGLTLWDVVLDRPVDLEPEDDAALRRTRRLILALHNQAGRAPVSDVIKALLDRTGYRAALLQAGLPRAVRNVDKLLADAHAGEQVGIAAFLEYLGGVRNVLTREGEARTVDEGAVQIMTIHAAKGLEFPVVVLGDINAPGINHKPELLLDPELGVVLPVEDEAGTGAASYVLAAARNASQEEAERMRLLYVAATRAEELLIFNGNVAVDDQRGTLNRLDGWLRALAGVTGLVDIALDGYAPDGRRVHEMTLNLEEVPVGVRIVEPGYERRAAVAITGRPALSPADLHPTPALLRAWKSPAAHDAEPEEKQRLWRVVPRDRQLNPPPWLVGTLVHESLAAWRFPGPNFDPWLESRARSYGMSDLLLLQRTLSRVRELLLRLKQHRLYHEIAGADRRLHEIPYAEDGDGEPAFGTIDLLYRRGDAWTVVDFKSESLRRGPGLNTHLDERGYPQQLRRYGAAVRQLWGTTPRLLLCLLDLDGQTVSREISM